MQSWQTLIDTASKLCGSQNELARRLDCQSGQLSQVRRGKTTISQQKLTVLAEILGPKHYDTLPRGRRPLTPGRAAPLSRHPC